MSERHKIDLSGQDPREPFYLAASVSCTDGSIEFDTAEPIEATGTLEACTEACKELVAEHDFECFIYRCIPVRRVARGRTVVSDLKGMKKP